MEKRVHTESQVLPPELIHRIQLLLSKEEAARTSILSKSWRYAWSTIPNLRFPMICGTTYNMLIGDTLQRYHRNNLPIETLDLQCFIIEKQDLASLAAQDWIRPIASKSCLKELSLDIGVSSIDSFTLPNNIFSGENLESIKLHNPTIKSLRICCSSMINCVFLRVLDLQYVYLTEDILDNIVSTCSLLEKINLHCCAGLKTIKVKNLSCLRELRLCSEEEDDILEIDNLPGLVSFYYSSILGYWKKPVPNNMDAIQSVRKLHINGVIIDDVFFNMISTKFLFLEDLNVWIGDWGLESLVISSGSLKHLTVTLVRNSPNDVQVYAPKLVSFTYKDRTIPTLLFPDNPPKQIELVVLLLNPHIDLFSFLLKMREVLKLPSTFDIRIAEINYHSLTHLNTDLYVASSPVTNVQQLSHGVLYPCPCEEDTPFSDAIFDPFFSICHPIHFKAQLRTSNHNKGLFSKLIIRGLMEKKTVGLKDVLLKNPQNGRWEALTSSWETVVDTLATPYTFHSKLNWFSHQ